MPRFSGKDVLRILASKPRLKDVHVVMFSTSTRRLDIDDCMRLGARDYLVKPDDRSELRELAHPLLIIAGL